MLNGTQMDKLVANKPLYDHDCDGCEFLGSYETGAFVRWHGDKIHDDPAKWYDLYVHWEDGQIDTVVARMSDVGSDYTSGLHGLNHMALQEAIRRAIKLMRRTG